MVTWSSYARGGRETGGVNTPDLDGAVVTCAREAELRRVESERTDGIKVTGEYVSSMGFGERRALRKMSRD